MDIQALMDSDFFKWIVIPFLIFLARVCDVSLGTIRIMFVSRGDKLIAPILGFFEVIIWLLAIGQIMKNLSNPFCYLAYGFGFAFGNFIGIIIEEKMALGKHIIRIITQKGACELTNALRSSDFGVTDISAEGSRGNVRVIYTIIERSDLERVAAIIDKYNPKAFYTIEDIRAVRAGIFPGQQGFFARLFGKSTKKDRRFRVIRQIMRQRKGK